MTLQGGRGVSFLLPLHRVLRRIPGASPNSFLPDGEWRILVGNEDHVSIQCIVAPTDGWSPSVGSRPGYLVEPRNRIGTVLSSGTRDGMCNCMRNIHGSDSPRVTELRQGEGTERVPGYK
jgi:hypothetical protein